MRATFRSKYNSRKTGNPVFTYVVSGTEEELNAYREAQGSNLVEDTETGDLLYFTTLPFGKTGNLIQTQKGTFIADTSELDMAAAISTRYGGNLGQSIADQAARSLFGNGFMGNRPTITSKQTVVAGAPGTDMDTTQLTDEQLKEKQRVQQEEKAKQDAADASEEAKNVNKNVVDETLLP